MNKKKYGALMPNSLAAIKSEALKGEIHVPGDKSISHRALIFGGLAIGETRIEGLLEAEDILGTANALKALGVFVEKQEQTWVIRGNGVGGFASPDHPIDFGNSGTGSRLMMGAMAGNDIEADITGDKSLSSRPMGRVLKPLMEMGLNLEDPTKDRLPLRLKGTSQLIPIEYTLPVPSAQVKSVVLIAGLHAPGKTSVIENIATRDHTERMLAYFGAKITINEHDNGKLITVDGHAELKGNDIVVPGDPSSAAFLTAAAILCPGSEITIKGILTNPTRFGFYQTLIEMGADIKQINERLQGGEPVADIIVKSSNLRGVTVPEDRAPSMIDEYPCLACLASFASGETKMLGLKELRVKECDRLSVTAAGLKKCGVDCEIEGDNLIVKGNDKVPGGVMIETELDHRIAMSFLVLGLASETAISVDDVSVVNTSFPQFLDIMMEIGAKFEG